MRPKYTPKPSPHGPVRIVYSKTPNPISDPQTWLGERAHKFRLHPTSTERMLREALKVFEAFDVFFQPQVVLCDRYIGDLYCLERKILIEIDGWSHKSKQKYDKRRDTIMRNQGIRPIASTLGAFAIIWPK